MTESELVCGRLYTANVKGKPVRVRLTKVLPDRRYRVVDDATGERMVFVGSARFIKEYSPPAPPAPPPVLADLAGDLRARLAAVPGDDGGPPHVIVVAKAGTGKTTTLVSGLQVLRGLPPTNARGEVISPSPQQAAIWHAIGKSRDAKSVCFVAFGKAIAEELRARVPPRCEAMTMHSMGNRTVTRAFGRLEISRHRVQDVIARMTGVNIHALRRAEPVLLKATEDLVGLCKLTLTGMDGFEGCPSGNPQDAWDQVLEEMAAAYGVELADKSREVFRLVPAVLEACKDPTGDGCIDFNDMVWLPAVHTLPVYRYDLLLIDEAQDLSAAQQELALRAGRRLVLCGDPRQAIYGFAGADYDSIDNLGARLAGRCVRLPLTVTRRCGKAIVKEANAIEPDFEAHPSNPEGEVSTALYPVQWQGSVARSIPVEESYLSDVREGDFVVCRVNAPLVGQCFRLLRMGVRANIQGRDVGEGLVDMVKRFGDDGVPELVRRVGEWLHSERESELARRHPRDTRLIALHDKHDCILAFTEGAAAVAEVVGRIEAMFTDERGGPGVRLSSIHKAKGLEAERVFFLQPRGAECPHPLAKTDLAKRQELNLRYVAITRAAEKLVHVV
jgi:DNA helicase II / ATP-dependent DNA helicase PcrA